MAYGLPRKHTVKSILRGSCYNVQEPWELALLTKTLYNNIANIGVPLFEDIIYGRSFKTVLGKRTEEFLLPTAEMIETERAFELKRLKEIELRKNAGDQVQALLKDKKFGLRRPLPPKK
ncbi:uncharacterized protein C4orf36 [Monodelphis domestica]|uniref:Chromosome 4 open reading frame 36 n=1 Tax=Monodelphis domestica TaxID=13616 RepID=F6ZZZ4_MONDO|nr:uncharacterized protein C4orf36 [Monodelphis domestica]XP_007495993.1 uncharacterized protein C4orf36 [Monodelphis domestica]XP_007495994.1 uncharacterized protein C4orf36 [Monodelphis domestica]XP_016278533.1 uncharacterized protein C4orf36 [Monodelphis domestica]XP_016278534.1 uncharacterized protein C4orf36 [Monodelphis domestica]